MTPESRAEGPSGSSQDGTVRALLVSGSSPGSSLYNYALMVWNAFDGNATFVHLGMLPGELPVHEPRDHIHLSGSGIGAQLIDAAINNAMPTVAFRRYRSLLESALKKGQPVHYTSIDVPPLAPSSNSVVTVHDAPRAIMSKALYSLPLRYRIAQWLRLQRYREFPFILAPSNHVRQELIEYGVDGSVHVIHPCYHPAFVTIDRRSARRSLGLPESKTLILSVSSAEMRKNLSVVKELIPRLGSAYAVVRVGPPLVGAINLGRLPQEALVRLFNACDVLLQPSLEEGFGSPVAEAFAVGLPVVASDIEVMREISDGAALLVDPRDPAAIERAIRTVVDQPSVYRQLSFGRAREFEFELFRSRVVRFFKEISYGLRG